MCVKPIFVDGCLRDCGKCKECKKKRTNELSMRLFLESSYWKNSSFWTFTYDDEHLPLSVLTGIPTLRKKDFQDFMKRLRKGLSDYGKIKVFYAGEYGGQTDRPHYHAILYGVPEEAFNFVTKVWKNGFTTVSPLNFARCRYCAKYMLKNEHFDYDFCYNHGIEPQFLQASNRPGIGYQYVFDNWCKLTRQWFLRYRGIKISMPRYYYKKLQELDEFYEYKLFHNCFENFMSNLKKEPYTFSYKSFEERAAILKQKSLNLDALYDLKGI